MKCFNIYLEIQGKLGLVHMSAQEMSAIINTLYIIWDLEKIYHSVSRGPILGPGISGFVRSAEVQTV